MIEETPVRFVLTGSSARKLKRTHTALMAGRTRRMTLLPFCYPEISKTFDLNAYLARGGLPPAHLAPTVDEAWNELRDYAGDYLREEILAEAIVRKIEAFSRFLPIAAGSNGQLINFEAIASDAQVPSRTVREYYSVLEDTLVGYVIQPLRFKGALSRKAIATSKFYFFDCGALNGLLNRKSVGAATPELGNLFETWVLLELKAFGAYRAARDDFEIKFWRDPAGREVDFLVNDRHAIEVKATRSVGGHHLDGIRALSAHLPLKKKWIICREPHHRVVDGIEILPYQDFLDRLWDGELK